MPNQWLLLLLSVVHLVPAGAATAPGLTPQPPGVVSARGETGRTYEAGDLRSEDCKWSTDPSARNGMRDGPSKSTRHLGPPPPISLKFDREAAYRIRTARNRREPAPAAPLTAPILTRRARFRALAP